MGADSDALFRTWAMCRPENGTFIRLMVPRGAGGGRGGGVAGNGTRAAHAVGKVSRKYNTRGVCSFGWCDQTAMLMLKSGGV